MDFDYDLFVIGGGSGGVRAARIAAGEHKARVGLAEQDRMGGTCVIRGCVPKKLMVFASAVPAAVVQAGGYGWSIAPGTFDWTVFRTRLHAELDRLEAAYRRGLANAGVTVHDSRARVVDPHTVELADGRRLTAAHLLVATGARPSRPALADAAGALSSDDIFGLPALPASMLIVGGGYIACEFACILAGLGVEVTQIYRGSQILRGFDDEARGHVAAGMRARGIRLRTGTDLTALVRGPDGSRATLTDGSEVRAGAVLFATGRVPNTEGLGLEAAGVALDGRGAVVVDRWSQTRVPSVYAVGDVTGRANLTPVAIRDGHAFADTVFGARPRPADHELIPSAVFTQPEFGTVGLSEDQAAALGPVAVYATSFSPMRSQFAGQPDKAFMKLVCDRDSGRILGCHIVAAEAGEMIQLVAVALRMGATKADFDRTIAVHPTMAEEIVTLRRPVRVT